MPELAAGSVEGIDEDMPVPQKKNPNYDRREAKQSDEESLA